MKKIKWLLILSVSLVSLSAVVYGLHYLFFHDAHHIFIYLLGDVAFVPIEVLLVTVIIHRVLEMREKRSTLHKMNMVIGSFFSQVGRELMELYLKFDTSTDTFRDNLVIRPSWKSTDFSAAFKNVRQAVYVLNTRNSDLNVLKSFLVSHREYLLRLLENGNLLEHELFTDLLWAVFHLTEELEMRQNVHALSSADLEHLANDMARGYRLLLMQWILYMQHLKKDYPFLFSLAIRTNPFDTEAQVEFS